MRDKTDKGLDRRPIKTRETGWANSLANRLARAGVSPNAISLAGMFAGVGAGLSIGATGFGVEPMWLFWLLGAVLVQVRLLCNLFDGMVAVELGTTSALGDFFNEAPDRVSDACILVGLGYSAGGTSQMGFLAALMAVLVAYLRAQGKASGAANEFCGPMAKPQRMFLVTAGALYCAAAPKDWPLVIDTGWGTVPEWVLGVIILGCLLTALRRCARITQSLSRPSGQ